MSIAIRLCLGGALTIIGLFIYISTRHDFEKKKEISWGYGFAYLVFLLIGIAIMGFGDRILQWYSLPDVVRWTIIGLSFVAGVSFYILMRRNIDSLGTTEILFLYGLAFFFLLFGIEFIINEFDH